MSSEDFVKWGIINILKEPEKINSWFHLKLASQLDSGILTSQGMNGMHAESKRFSLNDMVEYLYNIREIKNIWEQQRIDVLRNRNIPEFVRMAKREGG